MTARDQRRAARDRRVADGRRRRARAARHRARFGSDWCRVSYTIEVPARPRRPRRRRRRAARRARDRPAPSTSTPTTARSRSPTSAGDLTVGSDNGSITASRPALGHGRRRHRQRLAHARVRSTPPTTVEARSDNGSVEVVVPDTRRRLPPRHHDRQRRRLTTTSAPTRTAPARSHPHRQRQRRRRYRPTDRGSTTRRRALGPRVGGGDGDADRPVDGGVLLVVAGLLGLACAGR